MIWWLKKQFLQLKLYAEENYQNEAESLVIWYAVCYALGVAFYFALPWELPTWLIVVYLEAVLLLVFFYRLKRHAIKFLSYVLVFILGLCIAKADAIYRSQKIEKNVPQTTYISGQIADITVNPSGKYRLTIDYADDFDKKFKGLFRITTNQKLDWFKKGKCIELIAEFPKDYVANPLGNYNFARANFYNGISASGYAISPIFATDCEKTMPTSTGFIHNIREKIKHIIDDETSPADAAIIKALTIGDKQGIEKEQAANYRTSGLAHLLAISGMHMGMIALLVFFLIRVLLLPIGNGRFDWRKPAAIFSLLLTFGYFLISGQSISCIRAFIMTSCVLLAVLLNRRPISLRLWAFAVLVIATIQPIAIISPGFLMSFAAVLGIVSFYEKNAERLQKWYAARNIYGKIGAYLMGVVVTDLVASLMTLPYTIYYFHQISIYTTLGNLLAGPLMAFWVMPCLLLFLICVPLGCAHYVIKPLALGIDILNNIADWVAELAGAKAGEGIGLMPDWGIFIITLGILWLCVWQAKWRWWGLAAIVIGLLSLWTIAKPDFVFDKNGTTFACRTEQGQLISTPWHKNKFLTTMWTGDKKEQPDNTDLICHKKQCTCRNRIQFSRGKVAFDNQEIDLSNSGYINLKKGVIYTRPLLPRLWD